MAKLDRYAFSKLDNDFLRLARAEVSVNRRKFLAVACCATCAALGKATSVSSAQHDGNFGGCFLSPAQISAAKITEESAYPTADGLFSRDKHIRTTGDAVIDHDLDRAMTLAASVFKVKPSFGFYDPSKVANPGDPDRMIMNAWASPENTDLPGTKGTVGFGFDLFRSELKIDPSGSTIMAIIAHEFAHILQGDRGQLVRLRTGAPRKSEINADFLAGYFLGTRKLQNQSLSFRKTGELFIRLGEHVGDRPDRTHGNAVERINAAEAGFRTAYLDRKSLDEAVTRGLEYVGA